MTDAATAETMGFAVVDEPRRTGDGYYESVVLDPMATGSRYAKTCD